MALDTGSAGFVTIAASASINALPAFTRLLWVFFDTFVNASGVTGKGAAGTRKQLLTESANARFVLENVGSGGNFVTRAPYANFTPTVATGKWVCLCTTVDVATAASGKIYAGDQSTPVAEPSSYTTQVGTAGTVTDDSAGALTLGKDGDGDPVSDAKFAYFGLWNRVLTLAELRQQQLYANLVVPAGCVVWMPLEPVDQGGTGPQADLSGTGNTGTPTGMSFFTHLALPTLAAPTTGGLVDPPMLTHLQAPSRGGIYV